MRNDKVRLSLVIDVTYETGRTSTRDLERTLVAAAEHLNDTGLLSGGTEASVSTWSCHVVEDV